MRAIVLAALLPSLAIAGAGIGIKFDPRFVCEVDPNAPPPPSRSPAPSNTSVAPSTTMPPPTTTTIEVIETISVPPAVAVNKPNAACAVSADRVLTAVVVVALGVAATLTML